MLNCIKSRSTRERLSPDLVWCADLNSRWKRQERNSKVCVFPLQSLGLTDLFVFVYRCPRVFAVHSHESSSRTGHDPRAGAKQESKSSRRWAHRMDSCFNAQVCQCTALSMHEALSMNYLLEQTCRWVRRSCSIVCGASKECRGQAKATSHDGSTAMPRTWPEDNGRR